MSAIPSHGAGPGTRTGAGVDLGLIWFIPFLRVHFADMKHAPVLVLDVERDFEHDAAAQGGLMAQVGMAEAASRDQGDPLSFHLTFILPWENSFGHPWCRLV